IADPQPGSQRAHHGSDRHPRIVERRAVLTRLRHRESVVLERRTARDLAQLEWPACAEDDPEVGLLVRTVSPAPNEPRVKELAAQNRVVSAHPATKDRRGLPTNRVAKQTRFFAAGVTGPCSRERGR